MGNESHDDAGVFQVSEHLALVQTVDFFTPVVDDPRVFGQIAATNALSDVYAMGGVPLTALNLLAMPKGHIDPTWVGAMLTGGNDVMNEAGCVVIGGHSIDDPEPKMGYAVTGTVHPGRIWRNNTARAGDRLFLTKPIGTGVLAKAIKDGVLESRYVQSAVDMMVQSNRGANAILHQIGGPSAATDVTGFGLLGHAWEMAVGSGVRVVIDSNRVPLLPGSYALAESDKFPSGSRRNLEYVRPHLVTSLADRGLLQLLADAVTSGGLLFTVEETRVKSVNNAFHEAGLPIYQIGRMLDGPTGIEVR